MGARKINLNYPVEWDLWLQLKSEAAKRGEAMRVYVPNLLRDAMTAMNKKRAKQQKKLS
jgi:hypothetical protein